MSYSSRYSGSYSSRYGDSSSSRYGTDSTSRYGSDSMKDYSTSYSSSRYGDYSSRYSTKNNDYSRGFYSSRRLQSFDEPDEDNQRSKVDEADIEKIEHAKYFGESDKTEVVDEREEYEENPALEDDAEESDADEDEKEVLTQTTTLDNNEETTEAEDVEDVTNQTHAFSVSSRSPTQTVHEPDSRITTHQQTITKGKFVTTSSENVTPAVTKTFSDDSIPKKKVSDLIAKFNAKCGIENSQNHTNEWKQRHDFERKTVGKIQSTMFH